MAALLAVASAEAGGFRTLYEDDFSGSESTDLLGTATDVGGGTWTSDGASASFKADGSIVANSSASGIWLPVSIEPFGVYTLSADVQLTAGERISLGYAKRRTDGTFSRAAGYGTVIVTADSLELFSGVGTNGKTNSFSIESGLQQLQIVLDTTAESSADWTMEFFLGGVSIGGPMTVAKRTFEEINYVGFTTKGEATEGTIANFRFTVQKKRTFELGSCVQQLMWRYGGDLKAQLADLDAAAAAGVDWVRLTMVYQTNLDTNLIAIIQRCNALGIKVLMEVNSKAPMFPPGTERRPGNLAEGGYAYDSYRLSDIDLALAEDYLRDFFIFVQANDTSFQALELFNEMNWCSFNGDLPIVIGGLTIDEFTPWDDPVFAQYRLGISKVAQLTKVASDMVDEFFGGTIPIITCGQVSLNSVNPDAILQNGAGGSMASDVMTLKLMQGAYPQQAGASNYLSYADGIGIHMYPPTYDIDPLTAGDTAYAYITETLDPMLIVQGVGTTKPFWITEFGYTKALCGNNETNRLAQHEYFLDALTRYDRPKSAVGAAMHFVWNSAAREDYSVWTGTTLLKTAEIFLSSAEENTNWTTRLYDAWQVGHFGDQSHLESVTGSTIDFDGDGVENLLEYALGGNPADPGDAGFSPSLAGPSDGAWLDYTFPQRAGGTNSGIQYVTEQSDNLVDWNISGFEEIGTQSNAFADGLDAVTIRISREGKDQLFIRTAVEEFSN